MSLTLGIILALWLVGAFLGWSVPRRLLLISLPWAIWLGVLVSRAGQSHEALSTAVMWALLAPFALGIWLYSWWISGLKARVAERQTAAPSAAPAGTEAAAAAGRLISEERADGVAGGESAGSAEIAGAAVEASPKRLTEPELQRYSRHILLREVGGPGQMKLRRAKVLVVGAGGLGAPVLQYLAAAGVGTLAVIDDDTVDGSNLHRQVIHDEADIGRPKVLSAAERLRAQNPHVTVIPLQQRLTEDVASALFAGYDLVLDGTDNFDTRYLANRAAVATGTPLITGALTQWEGQVTLLDPARGGACYECLFPDRPAEGLVPACSVAGVIGPLPGIIGALMATEAVKLLTGAGESLRGRLLIWDALEAEMREIRTKANPVCPVCAGIGAGH